MSVLSAIAGAVTRRPAITPLQFANHETGDFSQWDDTTNWQSGTGSHTISTEQAHGGTQSGKLTVTGSAGRRIPVYGESLAGSTLPTTAYYSVWYWFPEVFTPLSFWNVFQFKRAWDDGGTGSDPVYTINVDVRTGNMYFWTYRHIGTDGQYDTAGKGTAAEAPGGVDIPVTQWVHLESLYTWNTGASGVLQSWQNGTQLWNLTGLKTEYSTQKYLNVTTYPRQWSVNNYTDGGSPTTHSLYIDDMVIATQRVYGRRVVGL